MATEINLNGKPIATISWANSNAPESEKTILETLSKGEIVSHAIKSSSRIVIAFDPALKTEGLVFPSEILERNDYTLTTFAVDSDRVVVNDKFVHCNIRYQGNRVDVSIPLASLFKVEYIASTQEECLVIFQYEEEIYFDVDIFTRMYEKDMQKEMAKSWLERKLMSSPKKNQTRPTETKFFLFRK